MSKPICELTDSTLKNLRTLVDANTIIGDAITTPDGSTILPVSKVSFGFGTGGGDLPISKGSDPFGGGTGGGVTIEPIAFLVIRPGKVELLQLQSADNTADRLVNLVPQVIEQIGSLIGKKTEKAEKEE